MLNVNEKIKRPPLAPGSNGFWRVRNQMLGWKELIQDCPRGPLCKHYMKNLEYGVLPGFQWHLTSQAALEFCQACPLLVPCIATVPLLYPKPILCQLYGSCWALVGVQPVQSWWFGYCAAVKQLCPRDWHVHSVLEKPAHFLGFLYPNRAGIPACASSAWEENCALCSTFWSSIHTSHKLACEEMILRVFTLYLKHF